MKNYTNDEISKVQKKNLVISKTIRIILYIILSLILLFLISVFVKNVTHNNDSLNLIKNRGYVIQDNGMSSTIKKNDIAICTEDLNDLKEEEYIVYQNDNNKYCVAKISEIRRKQDGSLKYIGKQDSNDEELVISIEKMKGKYVGKIVKIGALYKSHPAILGLYIFIIVVLILAVYNNKNKKEERAFSRHEIRMRYEREKKTSDTK